MDTRTSEDIAIVAISGRFPGADGPNELWPLLVESADCISHFNAEEMVEAGLSKQLAHDERYVGAKGVLDGADLFDNAFFQFSPREAESMDPQQRVFLECCWHAMELSGHDLTSHSGEVGLGAVRRRNGH